MRLKIYFNEVDERITISSNIYTFIGIKKNKLHEHISEFKWRTQFSKSQFLEPNIWNS